MSASHIVTIKEIRVLSGLSRGAAIPLDSAVYVGSDSACEIFLMDPGVEERHLLVELDSAGKVMIVDLTNPASASVEQAESRRFSVGDVELVWCESDTPWQSASIDSSSKTPPRANEGSNAPIPARRYLERRWMRFCLAGCVPILFGLVSVSIYRSHPIQAASATRTTGAVKQVLPAQLLLLRTQVQERLISKSFSQLSVSIKGGALAITGGIRGDQPEELETLIQSVRRENPLVRISLRLAEPSLPVLPFKIVAMVGGLTPTILLSTNQFLSIGSQSDGYRLVLVSGACLTFEHTETRQRLKECLDPSSTNR